MVLPDAGPRSASRVAMTRSPGRPAGDQAAFASLGSNTALRAGTVKVGADPARERS
jgi:hypothetical protein